jgi:phage baseplate assembly protein W
VSTLRYLGKGWSFPIAPGARKALDLVQGPDKVKQSIRIILDTEPGERIMRPTFGCALRRYLMKPNTIATRSLMSSDVGQALAQWEPRVRVSQISVDPGDDPALVLIGISYVHVRDGRPGNLVYPFYLE